MLWKHLQPVPPSSIKGVQDILLACKKFNNNETSRLNYMQDKFIKSLARDLKFQYIWKVI